MLSNETIRALPKMRLSYLRDLRADWLASEYVNLADVAWLDKAIADKEKRSSRHIRPDEFWA